MAIVDRQPLSRSRIIVAALDYIDQHGLAALSMRKLGTQLSVEAMSLYNHVHNKTDLLDGVADHVLQLVDVPDRSVGDWRERVTVLAHSFRSVGLAHPEAFTLLVGREHGRTIDWWGPLFAAYEAFREAGQEVNEAVDTFHAMAGFVIGFVLLEARVFTRLSDEPSVSSDDVPDDRPDLRQFLAGIESYTHEPAFDAGLRLFFDGVQASLAQRGN